MAPKKKTDEATGGLKPGPKSSEFWITIVCAILGTLVGAWGAYKNNDALVAIGGTIASGSGGAYTLSRGLAKAKNSSNGS